MIRVVIGGDIRPTQHDQHLFESGDAACIFGPMLEHLTRADLSIANLEAPLIERDTPISKSGANFGVSPGSLAALRNARIELLNLGNNHVMDHGKYGLDSTIEAVESGGFRHIGVGDSLASAARPQLFTLKDQTVGVFSFADTEFSIAGRNSPGANPLDVINFARTYREVEHSLDHSIVLLHAGKEHYKYPTPRLQQICRFMIEEGVDAVVCQHSHMQGAIEEYRDGVIFYGQGNFVFNSHPDSRPWLYRGFLVWLGLSKSKPVEYELVPFAQLGSSPGLRELEDEEEVLFLRSIEESTRLVSDERFVEKQWDRFCSDKASLYFSILRGHSRIGRAINRVFRFFRVFYSKQSLLTLLNIVRCQAHLDVLRTILEQEADKKVHRHPRPGDNWPNK